MKSKQQLFSKRLDHVPQSFVREILKVANRPEVVSFAGGLPNPELFPFEKLKESAGKVFENHGRQALQYAPTEGLHALRTFIAERYWQRHGLKVTPEQILITNGSQQALDLIGKIFIDPGDEILMERPSYLGALQCFSMFQPRFREVTLNSDGVDTTELEEALSKYPIKLFYSIPNFQNPTGVQYSLANRWKVMELVSSKDMILVEDDPYGEIAFSDEVLPPLYSFNPNQTILLGSFSKAVAPGLRLGWMLASEEIIKKATILKQASDLHSGNLSQYILTEFLQGYSFDEHLLAIKQHYKKQRDRMVSNLETCFPRSVSYTTPHGGMFIWLSLPPGLNSRDLLESALEKNIIFVPGDTFYVSNPDTYTLRLNFSNVDEGRMDQAMQVLGKLVFNKSK